MVALEMEEMTDGIRQDGIDKVWWDCEYQSLSIALAGRSTQRLDRPTTLLESWWTMEDGSGVDDLHLWTIQWKWSR
jgi:hypothetical protein